MELPTAGFCDITALEFGFEELASACNQKRVSIDKQTQKELLVFEVIFSRASSRPVLHPGPEIKVVFREGSDK